jgi:hypothetical protein
MDEGPKGGLRVNTDQCTESYHTGGTPYQFMMSTRPPRARNTTKPAAPPNAPPPIARVSAGPARSADARAPRTAPALAPTRVRTFNLFCTLHKHHLQGVRGATHPVPIRAHGRRAAAHEPVRLARQAERRHRRAERRPRRREPPDEAQHLGRAQRRSVSAHPVHDGVRRGARERARLRHCARA